MKKILAKLSISILAILMLAVLVFPIISIYVPGFSFGYYAFAESADNTDPGSMDTPTQTPEDTPTQTPEETPTQTPEESPTQTPEETPTETPEETPAPVMPTLSDIHAAPITYGQTLGNSTVTGKAIVNGSAISGTFAFSDPNGKPTVSDSDSSQFSVVFTPNDTSKYKTALGTTTIHVNKADSSISFNPASGSISVYYPNKMKFTASTNNTEGVLKAVSDDDDIKSISAVSGSGYNRTFEIVPKGSGHADITVSVAETANYKAASATYTVYIKDSTGIEYTVQFHKNGDGSYWTNSNYPSYVKTQGHKISSSRVPGVARPGWYFAGWYTAPTGGSRIYFPHEFTYDTDLYAHWSTVPVTGYEDHIWLWCGTLAIGLIGIWTSLSMRSEKRKRKHEKD